MTAPISAPETSPFFEGQGLRSPGRVDTGLRQEEWGFPFLHPDPLREGIAELFARGAETGPHDSKKSLDIALDIDSRVRPDIEAYNSGFYLGRRIERFRWNADDKPRLRIELDRNR